MQKSIKNSTGTVGIFVFYIASDDEYYYTYII